jgi:hypothetical protein
MLFCLTVYSNFSMSASAHHANAVQVVLGDHQHDHGHSHDFDDEESAELSDIAQSVTIQFGDSHSQSHEHFGADHHQTMALPSGLTKLSLNSPRKSGPYWQHNAWINCLYSPDRPPSV